MARKQEYIRWAIVGDAGLYVGQCLTRNDAIAEHVQARYGISQWSNRVLSQTQRECWEKCRAKGDRAVKVKITLQ